MLLRYPILNTFNYQFKVNFIEAQKIRTFFLGLQATCTHFPAWNLSRIVANFFWRPRNNPSGNTGNFFTMNLKCVSDVYKLTYLVVRCDRGWSPTPMPHNLRNNREIGRRWLFTESIQTKVVCRWIILFAARDLRTGKQECRCSSQFVRWWGRGRWLWSRLCRVHVRPQRHDNITL